MQNPLDKVVFIQKITAFTKKIASLKDLFHLAYVNNSWNDTIKNYSFHFFEQRVRDDLSAVDFHNFCDRAIKSDVTWFVNVLLCSNTLLHGVNLPRLVCRNAASSVAMVQLVFHKVFEAGGKELLHEQLTKTDYYGMNCLMLSCKFSSSSKVVKVVLEKIVEVGGLLQSQLTYKDSFGSTFLMTSCYSPKSREVLKLVFDKIEEAGGKDLLKSQLSATDTLGWTCLMHASRYSSSPEVVKLIFAKIVEAGDTALLKTQLNATAKDCSTCLMLACNKSSSPEIMKLICEKILEVGGIALLKTQLCATDSNSWTCLLHACQNRRRNPQVIKLLAAMLVHLGLFEEQYEKLRFATVDDLKMTANIDSASWTPDPESLAEVNALLK